MPDYQKCMLPLLRFAADEKEHSARQAVEALANQFRLSENERRDLLPSGRQPIFNNRVGWAGTYLRKAGLLQSTRRGHFSITRRGLDVLRDQPKTIDKQFLDQFEEFREFRSRSARSSAQETGYQTTDAASGHDDESSATPREVLEDAYQRLRDELAGDILEQVKAASPRLFEELIVELRVNMGYGGSRKDAGQAVGRGGDEGIDGIIKEDRLGLDTVYLQAKRWEQTVGRPEIQRFADALQGQRARKGVFITTSNFSREARDYASQLFRGRIANAIRR